MNIIELLKRQHEEARDMLDRIIAEDDKKESRSLLGQLAKTLRVHMQIEEKMVYPAASKVFEGNEDDEEMVLESYEEHEVARRCLDALESTAPGDRRFAIRARVLKGILDKHIEEEESELFPELEGKLGYPGIERLSEQVERRMSQLQADAVASQPRVPRRARVARASRATRAQASSRRGARGRATKARGTARGGRRVSKRRAR